MKTIGKPLSEHKSLPTISPAGKKVVAFKSSGADNAVSEKPQTSSTAEKQDVGEKSDIATGLASEDVFPVSAQENLLSGGESVSSKEHLSEQAPRQATPLYRNNPAPLYPRIARKRGQEGIVLLEVFVSINGKAGDIRIAESSGYETLDEAAEKAVRRWLFTPGMQNGKTIAMWVKVPIRFMLEEQQ
jgi:protein TonB